MLHSAAVSSTPMRRVGLPTAMRPFLVVRGRGVRAPPARFFVDHSTVTAPAARPGIYVASGLAATPSRRMQERHKLRSRAGGRLLRTVGVAQRSRRVPVEGALAGSRWPIVFVGPR